jgi:hypothetical protein
LGATVREQDSVTKRAKFKVNWQAVTRLGRLAIVAIAAITFAWIAFACWQYAYRFVHAGCSGAFDGLSALGFPADQIAFKSSLGYTLNGWFSPGSQHPETVIVVLPGDSANTQYALPDAAVLAQAGYSTLIYEHRSCANPRLIQSGGYYEAADLTSAVAYLKSRSDVRDIGVLGFSSGGTAAILAAARQGDIEAVIAEGGFASMDEDILQSPTPDNPLDWLVRRLVLLFLRIDLGVDPSAISPRAAIGQISPRPVLLIYGEYEAGPGREMYAAALHPKELWLVPGAGHGGYQTADPREYDRRIVVFFDRAFQGGP